MKRTELRPQRYVKHLVCDRCGREAELNDTDGEFHEFTSIQYRAGYGSVFGDGNDIEIDLCQHCLAESLGSWLHVTNPMEGFSLQKHGGEFPSESETGFRARGHSAIARSIADDDGMPAEQVIAKLEKRLARAKSELIQRQAGEQSKPHPASPLFSVGAPVVTNTPLPDLGLEAGAHGSIVLIHDATEMCDVEFVSHADGTTSVKTVGSQWLAPWKLL